MSFDMVMGSAERWLHHMEAAIAKIKSWDAETVSLLKDYFRYQAHFLAYSYAAAYPEAYSRAVEVETVGCCGSGHNQQRDDIISAGSETTGCCGGGCNQQEV